MCVILDNNRRADYINNKGESIRQVRNYIERGKLKLVLSQRLLSEYGRSYKVLQLLKVYDKNGFMKLLSIREHNQAEIKLEKLINRRKVIFKSNDFSTLALALVTETKLLVTKDKKLEKDLKNSQIIGGKIYKDKDHKRLLDENRCPN